MTSTEDFIMGFACKTGKFSSTQLNEHMKSMHYVMPTSSVYYSLNKMIRLNKLMRTERGIYSLPTGKPEFHACITDGMREISDILRKALPFGEFCIYTGNDLTPLQHNLAANNIIYVETQRDTCSSAFNVLKAMMKKTYICPDKDMINRYINLAEPAIFVKPLVSESPVVKEPDGIVLPTLEKILVDINTDDDFFYLQGEETYYMFRNASERYSINTKRMFRYARRRNAEQVIKKFQEEIEI